ncbi:hypothetical protein LCGC14_1275770 [marine sediment metagenome]|uniref:Uncharacterized protein n=1 Tax=marine sediment metagenome TaxID=412755 RepID=A0A0F9NZW4_9ZZZZ
MESEEISISIIGKAKFSLRFIIPFIAIFFGFIYWLEGFKYFVNPNDIWRFDSSFILIIFWIFTLCYLLIGFIRINSQSKILVLLIAISVSFNFYVMLMYNSFSEGCFFGILTSKDMFIIRLASYMSILGVVPIVIAIIAPNFQSELNYLTNITRIKDRESRTRYRFLEIWTSFPVFMGIHSIFFLVFVINDVYRCLEMPLNYVIILVLPWLFLMGFYLIYTSVVGLMK